MQLLVRLLTAGGEQAECWSSENGLPADPRTVGCVLAPAATRPNAEAGSRENTEF